ncbi:GAF domain-containing sensor histidine kinase [Clostridium estertheticum]|uniref:Circadian input-output histidine kinase CikA n=1 Tax=Clostridium estertheticum TaxID=238834 RepID=A0A7Y3SXR8_9CLOT|nr:GAF domain-containing sensor histidine kinase [Clostridium estertheticum]MBW9171714.1 GAF domain-containing sensor histidine kinase [Clostridium estertheticum]NNU77117.1 GAF domain-containing sensor histidine kinase [Clostridium estertheticum]WBL47798.1 GAF domain-containing sensor histidine kinase [Clostridium estertheticum]WLC75891.1 GAF domain-containing sensor histidine kinase [Clostridium estertheticum]
MMERLSNKFYLYIGVIIIINIMIMHIVIKIIMLKKSKEFDKKIISNIDIFKSTTNINDIFNKLLNNLYKNSAYDAAVSILKNDTEFKIMAIHGTGVELNTSSYIQDEKFINLINKVTESGTMYYIQDLNKVDYALYSAKLQLLLYHMRSLLMIPIIYKDEIYGVVIMVNYKKAAYNERYRGNAYSIVSQVAVAIENAKLFKKLKDIDETKTDFLSTVSHELRTPLTSIIGFTEMVKRKFEGTIIPELDLSIEKNQSAVVKIKRNINIILAEGERLSSLINELLDISRMEAGKVLLNMRKIDIEEIITQVITLTNPIIRDKSLQVIQSISETLPEIIADRDKLMQVIINLISNAIKFTEKGCIVCSARVVAENIIVSISDTGVGIREEDKKYIFEKFSQVGDTLTDKPTGTGLGLSICKYIIEEHGGEIWVESEIGKGTDFSFSIPIIKTN